MEKNLNFQQNHNWLGCKKGKVTKMFHFKQEKDCFGVQKWQSDPYIECFDPYIKCRFTKQNAEKNRDFRKWPLYRADPYIEWPLYRAFTVPLTLIHWLILGMIPMFELTTDYIALHWSVSERKAVMHKIISEQKGNIDIRSPDRYYRENEDLFYCDANVLCNKVAVWTNKFCNNWPY